MARFDPCNPCTGCVPGFIDQDAFKQAVLSALCDIYSAVTGDITVTVLPQVSKAFGFFTNAFQVASFVDANKKIRYLSVYNQTDGTIAGSFNNTDTHFTVEAGQLYTVNFGSSMQVLDVTTDLYLKYTVAPSLGNVLISGYY